MKRLNDSALLADIHRRLIMTSEDWRTLPSNPHQINTPVYIALLEVANVIEAALKSANDKDEDDNKTENDQISGAKAATKL